MPRRKCMAEARNHQLTLAVREADARMLRAEAKKLGISVSRFLYCRVMTPTQKPLPHYDCMALAGAVGRIGGLAAKDAYAAAVNHQKDLAQGQDTVQAAGEHGVADSLMTAFRKALLRLLRR